MLVLAGLLTRPIEAPAWHQLREREPALNLDRIEGALGQGVTVALLGGFRAMVANFIWLRANHHWERYDRPATTALIHLTTAVDPRPLYFWLNGARMIAYDMPNWRYDDLGGIENVPRDVRREIEREQSGIAFALLDNALEFHPDNPSIYIDKANIAQRRIEDLELAVEYYRQAALQPDAPFYAARIYAELLRRLDRHREAYEWLVELYPRLPPDNDAAMAPVVLGRIRDLEDHLGIPPGERYQPPARARPGVPEMLVP
ncbi:MAG: hypothetical protein EA425_08370 [Puniceicoccaceae bacterium]|nr:MAG: hypothetical protein EA425_08370 [Puniceicoccaceae bacterium]